MSAARISPDRPYVESGGGPPRFGGFPMQLLSVLAATAIVVMGNAALAQRTTCPQCDVNAVGTIGPTVTAKEDVKGEWKDPDAGRYGVPGGVGDPSVGANLT